MVAFTQKGAPYQLLLTKATIKQLGKLPKKDAEAILAGLEAMCQSGTGAVKPMPHSQLSQYRLRVGNYRAFFDLVGHTVQVVGVQRRGDKTYSNTKK